MARTVVWAFCKLAELDGQTGLVECDEELAQRLIEAGVVQDPAIGALAFKEIESNDAHAYKTTHLHPDEQLTTDLTPPKGRKSRR